MAVQPAVVDDSGVTQPCSQIGNWDFIPDRPSQKSGRTYKEGQLSGSTSSTTVYTVTAGKTLYVYSIEISIINTSTNVGLFQVRDSTTVKLPVTISAAGVSALASVTAAQVTSITFPEPKQFSTNFNTNIVTGTLTYSLSFVGYEE